MNKANNFIKLSTLIGIYEPIFYFLLITTLGLIRPDYHLKKNYVSELSSRDTAHANYINFSSFIMLGIAVIITSYALHENVSRHKLTKIADVLLIFSGLGLIMLGLVPADGDVTTKNGSWHRLLTGPAAVGMPVAVFCYGNLFQKEKNWKSHWPKFSFLTGSVMIIMDILLLAKKPRSYIGLIQRIGIGAALLWLLATSAKSFSLQHH